MASFGVSTYEPDPLNMLSMLLLVLCPFSFFAYTSRGALFLEQYWAKTPSCVRRANRLIAITVLPVPGPPRAIRTRFFPSVSHLRGELHDFLEDYLLIIDQIELRVAFEHSNDGILEAFGGLDSAVVDFVEDFIVVSLFTTSLM